jgi:hypothetical protein
MMGSPTRNGGESSRSLVDPLQSSELFELPLNKTQEIAGLGVDVRADPYTSVLVLNIGGTKWPKCPPHHWLYTQTR